jgi:hypothetical protein
MDLHQKLTLTLIWDATIQNFEKNKFPRRPWCFVMAVQTLFWRIASAEV